MKVIVTKALALKASARVTATDTGTGVDISDFTGRAMLTLNSAATEGATMTADVKLQHSDVVGSGYVDAGVAFTQVTNAAASFQALEIDIDGLKKFVRVVNTLAGTSPAVTYGVTLSGTKSY